tara:strand:+ start:1190 stop:1681 length:492 start_codon:yes stop_codon:yes gene_type:complete
MEIIEYLSIITSPFWSVFLISMIPIGELRLGIPIGIAFYKMSPISAFFAGLFGNFIIVPILLFGFKKFYDYSNKVHYLNIFYNYLFQRTSTKSKIIKNMRSLGLMLFIATPLPMTGAWTGCLAAFLFNIDKKRAIFAAFFGLVISGLIVTLFSTFFYNTLIVK